MRPLIEQIAVAYATKIGELQERNVRLRAALEAINRPFDRTMTGLETANLQREIARKALANEQEVK